MARTLPACSGSSPATWVRKKNWKKEGMTVAMAGERSPAPKASLVAKGMRSLAGAADGTRAVVSAMNCSCYFWGPRWRYSSIWQEIDASPLCYPAPSDRMLGRRSAVADSDRPSDTPDASHASILTVPQARPQLHIPRLSPCTRTPLVRRSTWARCSSAVPCHQPCRFMETASRPLTLGVRRHRNH